MTPPFQNAALERRVKRLEGILLPKLALSQPIPLPRDEPYEEGLQTNKIMAPQGVLQWLNALRFPAQPLALANGANQNVAIFPPFGVNYQIAGPSAGFSIGGLTGGSDGRLIVLQNTVSQTMTLNNQDAGSTAVNQILTFTGGNVTLRANGRSNAVLLYDATAAVWIIVALY